MEVEGVEPSRGEFRAQTPHQGTPAIAVCSRKVWAAIYMSRENLKEVGMGVTEDRKRKAKGCRKSVSANGRGVERIGRGDLS